MSEVIQETKPSSLVSVNKVDLLDGTYEGTMSGYSITIVEGPITTRFKANIGIRGVGNCSIIIKNGFAQISLK